MNFRVINNQTLKQVKQLWNYCFENYNNSGTEMYFGEKCLKNNLVIGGFDDSNKLMTMLHLNSHKISVRGNILTIPFLFGVATNPIFRGNNLFKGLFKMTAKILSAKNMPFVFTVPEYSNFFRQNEFAFTHFKTLYKMPLAELKVPKLANSNFQLQIVTYDYTISEKSVLNNDNLFEILAKVYNKNMLNKNAYTIRDKSNWENIFNNFINKDIKVVVVYEGENVVGYLLYKISNDTFIINEMIVNNPAVKNVLLQFVKQHVSQCNNLEWNTSTNDLGYNYIHNFKFAGQQVPFMMARVIDVVKALELLDMKLLKNVQCGELNILFQDSNIDDNNILIKLIITKDNLIIKYTNEKPDVYINAAIFVQLYFGTHSVEELVDNGFIYFENKDKIALIASLFPKCNNYINEYY